MQALGFPKAFVVWNFASENTWTVSSTGTPLFRVLGFFERLQDARAHVQHVKELEGEHMYATFISKVDEWNLITRSKERFLTETREVLTKEYVEKHISHRQALTDRLQKRVKDAKQRQAAKMKAAEAAQDATQEATQIEEIDDDDDDDANGATVAVIEEEEDLDASDGDDGDAASNGAGDDLIVKSPAIVTVGAVDPNESATTSVATSESAAESIDAPVQRPFARNAEVRGQNYALCSVLNFADDREALVRFYGGFSTIQDVEQFIELKEVYSKITLCDLHALDMYSWMRCDSGARPEHTTYANEQLQAMVRDNIVKHRR